MQEPRPSIVPTSERSGGEAGAGSGDPASDAPVTNFRLITCYGPMVACEYVGGDDVVVAEVPWLKVLRSLPDPMHRPKFGT